jgi:hypothetical protein
MILSVHLIIKHLKYWTAPRQQSLIVKILFMVPIYTITSYTSLVAYHYATYFSAVRDVYEAYVVYLFVKLVMQFGDGEANLTRELELRNTMVDPTVAVQLLLQENACQSCLCQRVQARRAPIRAHQARARFSHLLAQGPRCLWRFIHQFRHRSSLHLCCCQHVGHRRRRGTSFCSTLPPKTSRRPYNPGGKLVAVKFVVFLSFWQGFAIAIINALGWLPAFGLWTQSEVADGLQNYLTCIEMFGISIGHLWWFSYLPYKVAELKRLLPNGRLADLMPYAARARQTLSPVAGVQQIARDTRSAFREKAGGGKAVVEVFRLDPGTGEYGFELSAPATAEAGESVAVVNEDANKNNNNNNDDEEDDDDNDKRPLLK